MVFIQFNESKSDKFKLIILGNTESHTAQVGDITAKSVSSVTLIGITIDSKLNFKENINNIIKKTHYKLYVLRRLTKFPT